VANRQRLTSVVQIRRLLAYVWLPRAEGEVMANAAMVRRGFAQVMTIPPNVKYRELLLTLQR
jgi:micrococcal nuclease